MIVILENHPYVRNYFIKKHKSGIVSLTFNTKEKWITFHSYNHDLYKFGDDDDNETEQQHADRLLPVELAVFEKVIQTVTQCKDQITFYFIPIELLN